MGISTGERGSKDAVAYNGRMVCLKRNPSNPEPSFGHINVVKC